MEEVVVPEEKVLQGSEESQSTEVPAKEVPGTKEWYQSQHDKTVKELEQIRQTSAQKEAEYQRQLQQFGQEIEKIKNPPKPQETLVEPVEPDYRAFGFEDERSALADGNYVAEVTRYNKEAAKYALKLQKQNQERFDTLNQTIQQKQKLEDNQRQFQQTRAKYIGGLMKEGLDTESATKAFDEYWEIITSGDIEKSASMLAKRYKAKAPEIAVPEEKPLFPLPGGISGGGKPPVNPEGFTKSTDHSWITKTK